MGHGLLTQEQIASAPVHVERHLPKPFVDEMLELERELDQLSPGWMRPGGGHVRVRPFGNMPPGPHKTRLRWVLKRHMHLLRGVDWSIRPVVKGYETVMESVMGVAHVPGVSYEPPKLVDARLVGNAPQQTMSPLRIALELGRPLELVERAEATRPADENPLTWARAWFAARTA